MPVTARMMKVQVTSGVAQDFIDEPIVCVFLVVMKEPFTKKCLPVHALSDVVVEKILS
jgi:hypothetical protein